MRATILCENSVFHLPGAVAEHGLSIYLETPAGNYLVDTGQGKAIINNALVLGIDFKSLQGIIISHHHWDHTGGLGHVLDMTGDVEVFAHPDLFKESYSIKGKRPRFIGVPYPRPLLEAKGARFNFSAEFRQVAPGIWLTGEVPRRTPYELGDAKQVISSGTGYVQDEIRDDQSVVIETDQGLFVVLGCCHAGIINTLTYIRERMGDRPIITVIGGTHLGPVSADQQERSLEDLKNFAIGRLGVSHCTGQAMAARLAAQFGPRFFYCNVGTVVES